MTYLKILGFAVGVSIGFFSIACIHPAPMTPSMSPAVKVQSVEHTSVSESIAANGHELIFRNGLMQNSDDFTIVNGQVVWKNADPSDTVDVVRLVQ